TPIRFQDVNRADVGVVAPLDQAHDVPQRLAGVVAVRDELTDLLQGQEERALMAGAGLSHVARVLQDFRRGERWAQGGDGRSSLARFSGPRDTGLNSEAAAAGANCRPAPRALDTRVLGPGDGKCSARCTRSGHSLLDGPEGDGRATPHHVQVDLVL